MEDPFKKTPHGARLAGSGGGLNISASVGIANSKLQEIVNKFRTLGGPNGIEADMKSKGPAEFSKPGTAPMEITPEMLSTTNPNELTRALAENNAWLNYYSPMMATVEAGLAESENILKLVEAQIRKDMLATNKTMGKGEKFTAEEIDNEVLTNPTYQECLLEVQKMKQYRFQIEGYINIANRNVRTVSRQVTLRGQELEGSDREANVSRAGGGGRRYGPLRG